jgi:hypothetical protein
MTSNGRRLPWLIPILSPASSWSTSAASYLAPACTPAVWLAGITLVGDSLDVRRLPYRAWYYGVLAAVFVSLHVAHAVIVYGRY